MLSSIILAFLAINACTASPRLQVRAPCDDQHALCVAPDPEEYDTPKVGREIRHLLEDLRHSIATNHVTKRGVKPVGAALVERDPQYDLCCELDDGCYILAKRRSPFCYNQYTADFSLPGNFTGNLNTGEYKSPDGDLANLLNGIYILRDGTYGNIYKHHPPKPEDLDPVPFPFESMDPMTTVSNLVVNVVLKTRVTTLEGTTVAATTYFPGQTVSPVVSDGTIIQTGYIIPPVIGEGTTIPTRVLTHTKLTSITGERVLGEPSLGGEPVLGAPVLSPVTVTLVP